MLDAVYFADEDEKEEVRLLQTPGSSSGTKLPFLGSATQAGNNSLASDAERPTILFLSSAHFQIWDTATDSFPLKLGQAAI